MRVHKQYINIIKISLIGNNRRLTITLISLIIYTNAIVRSSSLLRVFRELMVGVNQ